MRAHCERFLRTSLSAALVYTGTHTSGEQNLLPKKIHILNMPAMMQSSGHTIKSLEVMCKRKSTELKSHTTLI